LPDVDIVKMNVAGATVNKVIVERGKRLNYNDASFREIHEENVTGWQNPYLCV